MKYNDPIVLEENEVHAMMLKKIRPNSKILEFGAASGRMTKILQEKYDCKVFIVEYEKEAFEMCMQYAADGICADIEKYEWEKWSEEKFDYIIFADVLEHLYHPQEVLRHTTKVLGDKGKILISVPNIGHNDIWIKLYNNQFEYTDIGLLDDTHIHFFAEDSLKSFVENAGYKILSKQYKTIPTSMTEQCREQKLLVSPDMNSLLLQRANGEVYQFVLELSKENQNEAIDYLENEHYCDLKGIIYYNRGKGFFQEDVSYLHGKRIGEELYEFHIDFELTPDIVQIRLDPIERQNCIFLDVNDNDSFVPDSVKYNNKFITYNEDPQIVWNISKETTQINYVVRVNVNKSEVESSFAKSYREIESQITKEKKINEEYRQKIGEIQVIVQEQQDLIAKDSRIINEQKKMIEEQEKRVEEQEKRVEEQKQMVEEQKQMVEEYQKALKNLYLSKTWRLAEFFGKIYRIIKRKK